MGKTSHIPVPVAAFLAIALCSLAPALDAATHPRLVSLEAAKCDTCHGKLIRGFRVVHAPVADDCTSCHDVTIGDDGTRVELSAPDPELCIMCHDDLEAGASADLATPHAPVTDSCQNCHTPHAGEHPKLLSIAPGDLCGSCHDTAELQEIHQGQLIDSVRCTTCHPPHGSDHPGMVASANQHAPFQDGTCTACHRQPLGGRIRLLTRGEKVCSACHGDVSEEAGENGSVHAALIGERARAGCVNCHNPHMSPHSTLLVEEGSTLCGQCHDSVVEAARDATGHPPAAEDCSNCHQPHASTNRHLLTEATPELCVMCHDIEDAELATTHLGADLGSLDCISCHSPHGAGNEHLLATHVHVAILDGCDTCHEGSARELVEDGESALCLACHDDIGDAASAAAFPHAAMEMARCADCHNPHASAQEKLLVAAGGGECLACHDDIAAAEGEVAHGIIELVGCRACHEPHGGEREGLLRLDSDTLCLGCHDVDRVEVDPESTSVRLLGRFEVPIADAKAAASLSLSSDGEHGHPTQEHRVLGKPTEAELRRGDVDFDGVLGCLTCHDPHKGKTKQLFRNRTGSAISACSGCHKK